MFGMIVYSCPLKKLKSCLYFINGVDNDSPMAGEHGDYSTCKVNEMSAVCPYKSCLLSVQSFISVSQHFHG